MSGNIGIAARIARAASPHGRARVARRLADMELSPIKEVELRASRIDGIVSLAQGIPSFDTPEPIKRFVAERMAEGVCARYSVTPGLPQLREAIEEALRVEGMPYDAESEILVTVGSIEAIAASLLATIDPGDEVLLVSPSYASYVPAIQIAGGVPRFVPLNEDANFDLDPDAIEEAVRRRTRVLLLCNPNNPTGTVFSREQTLRMLRVAERHDLLVIADEVYKDFLYGNVEWFSAAMEPSARQRVIRVCSFSKAYGMTGWRVGFLHGPAPLVGEILKVHDALVTCAPVVSQYAAIAALDLGAAAIAEFRAEFRRRRDHVIERLDALPQVFDYQKPNSSYFVFPRVKDTIPGARDSRRLAAELLDRARVALVPGVAFGPSGESHLRFCYARSPDDIDLAFDRLEDYFSGRRPRARMPAGPKGERLLQPASVPLHRRVGVIALRRLARARLARHRPKIVAITGTLGKTVMKRTLQELLGRRFHVHANPLSYNTDIGLALGILDITLDTTRLVGIVRGFARAAWAAWLDPRRVDVMVLELGIRRAGDMRAHLDLVQPDVVVITPLAPDFRHGGDDLTQLHAEVETLCQATKRPDRRTIVLCADDPFLADLAARQEQGTFSSTQLRVEGSGSILHAEGRAWTVRQDTVGDSSRGALVAAVSVGRMLGMRDDDIEAFLCEDEPAALATPRTAS